MRILFAAAFVATLAIAHAREISWNVRLTQTSVEGITLQRVAFSDGEKDYGLSIDDETNAEAIGAGTRFAYKSVPSASFEIRPSPVVPVLPFDGETLERYRAAARIRVPAGIAPVGAAEETLEPLNINRWRSFRVTYSYSQHGRKVRKCITFLTLESGQQAMLETSAYETEFNAAMERSEYLIRSWHELTLKAKAPDS